MDTSAVATFVALIFILVFLGGVAYLGAFKFVGRSLDERAKKIAAELEEAKRLHDEAKSVLADFQRRARNAEAEAADIVARAKEDAERMKVEAKAALEEQIARRAKAAERKIAHAEARAVADVRAAAADLAIAASAKVLAAQTDGMFGDDLLTASIADVKRRLN